MLSFLRIYCSSNQTYQKHCMTLYLYIARKLIFHTKFMYVLQSDAKRAKRNGI